MLLPYVDEEKADITTSQSTWHRADKWMVGMHLVPYLPPRLGILEEGAVCPASHSLEPGIWFTRPSP